MEWIFLIPGKQKKSAPMVISLSQAVILFGCLLGFWKNILMRICPLYPLPEYVSL